MNEYFARNLFTFPIPDQEDLLRKVGYTVETVKSFRSHNGYYGAVEYEDVEISVAYKEAIEPALLKRSAYDIENKHGIEAVFYREFKERFAKRFVTSLFTD